MAERSTIARSTVTLWDHGPPERCFDLAVLGAGFGRGERAAFAEQVTAFARELVATPPFGLLRGLVNLHRVDASASGPSGIGVVLPEGDERLLTVDEEAVLTVARREVSGVDAVLVVVNTERYAGSGGTVACATRHPRAAALAVHELGHSAFDLADEYGHQHGPHPGPGTLRANVTLEPDPARAPWCDLVVPGGAVGCFEGGDGYAGGVFRPQETCRMRSLDAPFCAVCAREIRRRLLAHREGSAGGHYRPISPGLRLP